MNADSQPPRLPFALLLASAMVLASCATKPPPPPPAPVKKEPQPLYMWDSEKAAKVKGSPAIVIDLTKQRATYYRGGQELGWTTVATGTWKHPTPTGRFRVCEKTADKMSNLYGKMLDKDGKVVEADAKMGETPIPEGGKFEGAKMDYFMRFTSDGVGMHVGPIPRPGRPASHGCVRTPRVMAKRFFEITPMGTPVAIIETPREPEPGATPPQPEKKKGFSLFRRVTKVEEKPSAQPTASTAAKANASL